MIKKLEGMSTGTARRNLECDQRDPSIQESTVLILDTLSLSLSLPLFLSLTHSLRFACSLLRAPSSSAYLAIAKTAPG